MSGFVVGLVLAVGASVAITSGFLLQHAGVVKLAPVTPRRPLVSARSLLGSRAWRWGLALGVGGWGLHVVALSLSPLSLVQAFYAGGLALAAPIAAVGFGHRLARSERRAIVLMAGGLVMLSLGIEGSGRHGAFGELPLTSFLVADLVCGLGLVMLARGRERPAALGLASGAFYGATDTAIKALTHVVDAHGALAVLVSPWLAFAALATGAGFFALQRGLQTGRALAVIGLNAAISIVVSVAAGLVVFGDPLGTGWVLVCLHLAAFATVAVASWMLAPQAMRETLIQT
ncbi:MAG: hypothetical protein M3Z06_11665 [Actinomycetota bacterium]|nr:hypothetical protein [Actinomycetota bacterium]